MKSKLKKILISFILIIVLKFTSLSLFSDFGLEAGHSGLLFALGLLFGPYGALGAALGNLINNMAFNSYPPIATVYTTIFSFGVSYLAYKLWYSGFKTNKITKPTLDNVYHLTLFLSIIIFCGVIYATLKGATIHLLYPTDPNAYSLAHLETATYFLNFVNSAFIFGILGIWISKKIESEDTPETSKKSANKQLYNIVFYLLTISTIATLITLLTQAESVAHILNIFNIAFIILVMIIWISGKNDFTEIPKTSKKPVNKQLYKILFYLLIIFTLTTLVSIIMKLNANIQIAELTLTGIILLCYLTKPFEYKIEPADENTITEKIIRNFLIVTLIIAIIGVLISFLSYNLIDAIDNDNIYLLLMPQLIVTDIIIVLFFIPGLSLLRYFEKKVLKPINSFSEIERFIEENEKIESDGIVEIYSEYLNENNEIGTLARSYTELINHNNNYIENIHKIEGEKERINAELNIATKIQVALLPTKKLETDDFIINGYSKPAREVGGDFFDYYMLDDDNLAIVIGDASDKGIPAAVLTMITQVIIKQMLKHDKNPSKVLSELNNQLNERNPESMFVTLWLGIYNKTNNKVIFSNAGHNPPLIKENGKFEYLNMDKGVVLGILEDYEFLLEELTVTDELILYTDGITDADNEDEEMYGEERLLNFFNRFESNEEPIIPLLNDIKKFTKDTEQYDDMTLLYLRKK